MPAPATAIQFEDSLLVEQCQQGDMAAFAQLIAKYQDRVFNTCWRICGNREDAADLTQDAFCKALESIGSFKGKSRFYTWLYRIAVNQSLSHRKKESRTVPFGGQREDAMPMENQAAALSRRTGASKPADPPAELQSREEQRLVVEALNALEADYRRVVVLRDIEGLDYAEIGEVLELPAGTVKSRLHRGRMALRERLQHVL